MGILSTGFVTLVDLTDQRPVQFYLEINGSRVQSKGGDGTYQPDFTKTPINIEPKLFFGNDNPYYYLKNYKLLKQFFKHVYYCYIHYLIAF